MEGDQEGEERARGRELVVDGDRDRGRRGGRAAEDRRKGVELTFHTSSPRPRPLTVSTHTHPLQLARSQLRMANAESGPSCRGASRPAASASAAARSPLGTDVKALVDPQPSGPSKRRRSMAPGPDAAAPDTRKRSKKSSQKAPSPTILDISDSDESSEDEAVPPAPRPPPPPPPPPPRARAPAIAAPRRKLAKLGTADPGLRARPAAAYAALLARETLGRPFYPKKMRAHTAASAEKRRIFEGEDCHALALSLSVDDPML